MHVYRHLSCSCHSTSLCDRDVCQTLVSTPPVSTFCTRGYLRSTKRLTQQLTPSTQLLLITVRPKRLYSTPSCPPSRMPEIRVHVQGNVQHAQPSAVHLPCSYTRVHMAGHPMSRGPIACRYSCCEPIEFKH